MLVGALVISLAPSAPVSAATASSSAAATAAAAAEVSTVTRVDSSVQVTPDSLGRVTIPYCPASDPCAFAAPPANTVVTGRGPTGGGPPIPAKLLAYGRTTTGFTLRAMDTAGALITTAIQVWYHAASTLTQNEEVRTVTVTTDANRYATVAYATPRGVAATAVIASGASPNGGDALARAQIDPTSTARSDTGDGLWLLVGAQVPTTRLLLHPLATGLASGLVADNRQTLSMSACGFGWWCTPESCSKTPMGTPGRAGTMPPGC